MTVVKGLIPSISFAAVMLAIVVDFAIAVEVGGICNVGFEQVAMSTAVSSHLLVHCPMHKGQRKDASLENEKEHQQTYHFVQ